MNNEFQMRPESSQDIEYLLRRWIPVVVSVVAAVVAGYWVGNNDWGALAKWAGVAVVCFVACSLQDRGWILIPLFSYASGRISLLPLPFSYHDLSILLAIAAYVAHRAMVKTEPVKMGHILDWLTALNVGWIAMIWLRKPVGFLALQSEYVGARLYMDIGLAALAAWVIIQLPRSLTQVRHLPYYILGSCSIHGFLSLTVFLIPSVLPIIQPFYAETLNVDWQLTVDFVRFRDLCDLGAMLILTVASHSSLYEMFHLLRWQPYLMLSGTVMALVGGFRGVTASIMAYLTLGVWLRGGRRALLVVLVVMSMGLTFLLLGQGRFYSLPLAFQRSLSFLPAAWSPIAVLDAAGSSQSRFDWWADVVKFKLIKNWWIGDGLGYRLAEMNTVAELSKFNFAHGMEFYGSYHSGPLQTIRFVGIVGLILLLVLMIATAVAAGRCLRKARGGPLESLSIFLAIQAIWIPFAFVVIFGSYGGGLCGAITLAAYVRLVGRMLDEQAESSTTALAAD